jgi:hypothetical protein
MVEEALDALYAGPVEAFVAERDRLAKEHKARGDKDGAALIKAQHKPTQVAHALNMLVRKERPLVDALLEVGRALASGGDGYRAALEKQRTLVQELNAKAAALADGDAHALVSVVQGAMASTELAGELLKARFSKLPEVPVGFFGAPPPVSAAAPPSPPRPAAPVSAPAPAPPKLHVVKPAVDEKQVAELRRKAHEDAVRAAEKLAAHARAEAAKLGEEAERAAKAATEAEKRARHLEAEAKKLRDRHGT